MLHAMRYKLIDENLAAGPRSVIAAHGTYLPKPDSDRHARL
jgi:hypothetical protein